MIGELFAIASVIAFVTSNVLFRRIDKDVSPSQINAFRTTVGLLTYLVVALILWQIPEIKNLQGLTWLWLLLSFFFGQVCGDTAYFKAQERLGTTIALAVSMIFPIFTTIMSIFILDESLPYYFYISLFLTIAGVIVITIGQERSERLSKIELSEPSEINASELITQEDDSAELRLEKIKDNNSHESIEKKSINRKLIFGILIGLFAALSWSAGIILTEKAFDEVSLVLTDNRYTSLIGNLVRFPVAAGIISAMTIVDYKKRINKWNKKIWLFLIIGSLLGTSLGLYLFTEAIVRANAAVVSLIGSSSPLVAIPISWLINKEKSNGISIIGVIITTLGIINIFIWQLVCTEMIPLC
jgi:drug/metabolite transporter (DMT)-like permease